MKIIEAMKKIKDLQRKANDLRDKISRYAADVDVMTPTYENQAAKVAGWLQAHGDIVQEILHLRFSIQKTNVLTSVGIELGDQCVTKTIAEWIHRRRDLSGLDAVAWGALGRTEKAGQLKEGAITGPTGEGSREVKIRRYYNPEKRDQKLDIYQSEPSTIDGRLEVINAITDLVE